MQPKNIGEINQNQHLLATVVRKLLPFTAVRPTSAQQYFLNFWKIKKHTCTFYIGKTHKCAVIVFSIMTKNLNIAS